MERDLTYFISDLHLGAAYFRDPETRERRAVEWLRHIAPRAKRLYLLGDIFDYWYEYRTVVPRGYTRFLGALAELADQGVEITWFKGNHDMWTFGYLEHEIGLRVVDDYLVEELDGKRFFMAHGDGQEKREGSFRFLRALFRSRICQVLFSSIHPRWTVPMGRFFSSRSRGDEYRQLPDSAFDPAADSLAIFARAWQTEHGHVDYFIFGHKHLLVDTELAPDTRLVILGDWITRASYAVWDGKTLKLEDFGSMNKNLDI